MNKNVSVELIGKVTCTKIGDCIVDIGGFEREYRGVTYHVIQVIGKLDRLKDSIVLKSYIITLLERNTLFIVLDLSGITYWDSGAFNVIIYTHNKIRKKDGQFIILDPNEYVNDGLEVTGLNKFVPVLYTINEVDQFLLKIVQKKPHPVIDIYTKQKFVGNTEHKAILEDYLRNSDIEGWNRWKSELATCVDLAGIDLSCRDLQGIDLSHANLQCSCFENANLNNSNLAGCDLTEVCLMNSSLEKANLKEANLTRALFHYANLWYADLWNSVCCHANFSYTNMRKANLAYSNCDSAIFISANMSNVSMMKARMINSVLSKANLSFANISHTDCSKAKMNGATLHRATFEKTNLKGANLNGSFVYGISVWDIITDEKTEQVGLVISNHEGNIIEVDNLKNAQLIHHIRNNNEISDVIDTVSSKIILILGSFKKERLEVLQQIKTWLQKSNYVPVLFDFQKPVNRDTLETISAIAHISKFIVADLTNAKSVLQELQSIIPNIPSVRVKPLLQKNKRVAGMVDHFKQYHNYLDVLIYEDPNDIYAELMKELK